MVVISFYELTPGPDIYGGVLAPEQGPGIYVAIADPDIVEADPNVTLVGSCWVPADEVPTTVFPAGINP